MEELGWGFFSGINHGISKSKCQRNLKHCIYWCNILCHFFFEKTYPISLTTLCVLTHWRFAVVFEDEVSLLPHTSLVLVTVALTICSMEDFQCLWKLFKDGLNLLQIYQERTLSLFFFCPPSFPFFLRVILLSYRKAQDYPLSPQLLRTFEYLLYYYFFTFHVNTVAWSNVFF